MQPKPILLFALTVVGFGSAFSLTNIAVSSMSPQWVAAGRSLVALLGICVFLLLRAEPVGFKRTDLGVYLWVGLFTGVAPYLLISWGQQYLPSSFAGAIFASTPLLTLLLGVALFKAPRPHMSAIAGASIGLAGVGLTISVSVGSSTELIAGAAASLCAAASYAIGGLMVQRHPVSNMAGFSAMQLVPTTVVLIITALAASGAPADAIPVQSLLALIALGLFGTCAPLLSIFYLIKLKGAGIASLTTFFLPFAAIAFGVGFLGEDFPAVTLLGVVIAILGSVPILRSQVSTGVLE